MNPLTQPTQTGGVVERMIYAAALAVMMKLVQKGYIDQDMAIYLATGAVAFLGGAYGWYINRPAGVSQSAAANLGTAAPAEKAAMVSAVADLPEVTKISLDKSHPTTREMNAATPDNVQVAA